MLDLTSHVTDCPLQLVNDTTFARARADLGRHRVAAFRGLAIIDWEGWRPTFHTNFGGLSVYQRQSRNLVRRRNPGVYNTTMVDKLAEAEWDAAAR